MNRLHFHFVLVVTVTVAPFLDPFDCIEVRFSLPLSPMTPDLLLSLDDSLTDGLSDVIDEERSLTRQIFSEH